MAHTSLKHKFLQRNKVLPDRFLVGVASRYFLSSIVLLLVGTSSIILMGIDIVPVTAIIASFLARPACRCRRCRRRSCRSFRLSAPIFFGACLRLEICNVSLCHSGRDAGEEQKTCSLEPSDVPSEPTFACPALINQSRSQLLGGGITLSSGRLSLQARTWDRSSASLHLLKVRQKMLQVPADGPPSVFGDTIEKPGTQNKYEDGKADDGQPSRPTRIWSCKKPHEEAESEYQPKMRPKLHEQRGEAGCGRVVGV